MNNLSKGPEPPEPRACCTEDSLAAFAAGALEGSEKERIASHVQECERCTQVAYESAASQEPHGRSVDLLDDQETQVLALKAAAHRSLSVSVPTAFQDLSKLPTRVDEFLLDEQIGKGAMGRVYRAWDTVLSRVVAIKVCDMENAEPNRKDMIIQEAKALARITHPNVVCCYRAGHFAGSPYLVFEFVDGQNLAQRPGPLPWDKVLKFGIQISAGLAAAHRLGVLHRDLKPANVVVGKDGVAKLVDFGLAQMEATPSQRLDTDAFVPGASPASPVGTPAFLAPELWQGEEASQASDIYAVGALLYNLCSGKLPFSASSIAELRRAVLLETPSVPPVEDRTQQQFIEVLMRCLQKRPQHRPSSAEELHAMLLRIQQGRAMDLPPPLEPARSPGRMRLRLLAFGRMLPLCTLVVLPSEVAIQQQSCEKPDSFCPWFPAQPEQKAVMQGLSAMSGVSLHPNDVWLVGHSGTPDEYNKHKVERTGVALHVNRNGDVDRYQFDARLWDVGGYTSISKGHDASDQVFAAGETGIYRFAEGHWIKEHNGNASGIWADGKSGVWAVGTRGDKQPAILYRQSSGAWIFVADDVLTNETRTLHAIVGTNERIFASGRGGLLVEVDRHSQQAHRIETPPGIAQEARLFSLVTNERGDLFLLASFSDNQRASLVVRYEVDSKAFLQLPVPGATYFGMWLDPAQPNSQQVWLTGSMAAIWRCDFSKSVARACKSVESGVPETSSLRTIFGPSTGSIWAVGYDRNTAQTQLLRYQPGPAT